MRRRLDLLSQPPPPPLLADIGGGITETVGGGDSSSSSSKGNLTPSLLIVVLILISVILFSILLRYLSGRSSSSSGDHDVASDHAHHAHRISSRRVSPDYQSLIDSLPLFSFDSITGLKSSSAVDCAVCLSKFEPHDQLRLLPLCCHAFHARCIDTWLASSHTCPLCRSTIHLEESDEMAKLSSLSAAGDSFRLEIGSFSRQRAAADSSGLPSRRSYSMGSFEYVVEDESEVVVVEPMHRRGVSDYNLGRKDKDGEASPVENVPVPVPVPEPPGAQLAAEVAGGGRSWLKDYLDRLASSASSSFSSRTLSFRFSGRNFTESSRRSDVYTGSGRRSDGAVAGIGEPGTWDLEGNWVSEEMGSFFRWLSGV